MRLSARARRVWAATAMAAVAGGARLGELPGS